MGYWLLKTEPETYGWKDLISEGKTTWDGVRGGLALKNLARMRPGDQAFVYHTGREKQIVGIAEVIREPYRDPNHPDSRLHVVDLVPVASLEKPVTLKEIKERAKSQSDAKSANPWAGWDLLRIPRLSVVPVSKDQWEAIMSLSRGHEAKRT